MKEFYEKIFKEINSKYEEHLKRVQRLIRQPSVNPLNIGIRDCAELVKDMFLEIGCSEARLVETSGNPVVFAKYNANAEKTVLVYMMYDTMPADEEGWIVPPFEGKVIDMPPFGATLVARGAFNTKGPLAAFLNAVEAIKEVTKELPVNLIFVAEGEEELGSRHLPEFIQKYQSELKKADVLFFPTASENRRGKPIIHLGVKGIVYFELDYGCKVTGCTLHFVDEKLDGGPIILQKAVEVLEDDTIESLKKRVQKAEQEILIEGIKLFIEGRLKVENNKVKILKHGPAGI